MYRFSGNIFKYNIIHRLSAGIVISCLLFLTSCGETEEAVTVKDVADYLNAGDETYDEADLEADDESGPETDEQVPEADPEPESDPEPALAKYDGLTESEYEALSLEEQDAVRDRARRAVTPAYVDDILPEYIELYEYNDSVIGYIHIDGTVIDGPVLQTLADYEYYLHRDIDGNESEPGCIILDADSEIGIGTLADGYLEDYAPSTIQLVHGHNMRNGTMFGSLLRYADRSYAVSHRVIDYDSLYEHRSYEVICAFYSQIYPEDSEEFKYYTWNQIDSPADYDIWWQGISDMALYMLETDVTPAYGEEYIVLSTCSYQTEDGRFALLGIRTE